MGHVQEALGVLKGLGTPAELREEARSGKALQMMPRVNSHMHLPPNFSAFQTVQQAVELADQQNVRVVGVTNYYDYRVYGEFSSLARQKKIFPLYGLEIISLVDAMVKGGVKINDPGNPGRLYICGKGVTKFDPAPAEGAAILSKIRKNDETRMRQMVEKAGAVFAKAGCALGVTEASVKQMIVARHHCDPELVYLQERHIAQAFQEAIFGQVPAERRGDVLARVCGVAPKAPVTDAVKTQNEFRSNFLRAGKPAFVVETFVSDDEARRMILSMGGIPCYPTLADGASPMSPYEAPVESLIKNLRGLGVTMAEFIPIRNSPEVLSRYVKAMRAAGLAVVGGTEHNTLDLIPIEPTCLKGTPVPDEVKRIFWEGACVVAAHQFLTLHGQAGFVESAGRPNGAYRSDEAWIQEFAKLGAAVIDRYFRQA